MIRVMVMMSVDHSISIGCIIVGYIVCSLYMFVSGD